MLFNVGSDRATPGSRIRVDIARSDRNRMLYLRLVERKPGSLLERRTASRTLTAVEVPAGTEQVVLPVAAELPPTYEGRSIHWSYQVRLGRLYDVDLPVDPPSEPSVGSGAVFGGSLPRRDHWAEHVAGGSIAIFEVVLAVCATLAVCLLVVALEGPWSLTLSACAAGLVFIGLEVRAYGRQRADTLRSVQIVVEEARVRPGEPVRVRVETGGRDDLEVGLVALELWKRNSGGRRSIEREKVVDRWMTAETGPLELTTHDSDPPSYEGNLVALQWFVALRNDAQLPQRGRASHRYVPIVLGY